MIILELVIEGGRIKFDELKRLLTTVFSKYNMELYMGERVERGKQVITINVRLTKPIPYAVNFSQIYNEQRDKFFKKQGLYITIPREEYGFRAIFPHYYHFAILNDSIAYIMESMKNKGYVRNWYLKSSIAKINGVDWRKDFPYKYYPQFDPAFKRPLIYTKKLKGIRITSRLDQAYELVKRIPKYIESGKLSPKDIPKLIETLSFLTGITHFYREPPTTLGEVPPLVRAYIASIEGISNVEELVNKVRENGVEYYMKEIERFLSKVETVNDEKFQAFLKDLVYEVSWDLSVAMTTKGSVADQKVKDTDEAGFPYGLAVRLMKRPYVPEEIRNFDVRRLVGKTAQRERVLA